MNRVLIGGGGAALVIGLAPALAQVAPPPGVAPGTSAPPMAAPRAPGAPPRVMIISDRVMTRDEAVKHVTDMFARLDTNRDGFITKPEVEALHQKMEGAMAMGGDWQKRLAERGITTGDRGAMFDRLDTNHDGNISRQEFMSGQGQVRQERIMIMRNGPDGAPGAPTAPGAPGMRMHMHAMGGGMGFAGRLFDMADSNHDGRVSLAEAQAAALAHFDRADTNHDGKITPDERQQMHVFRMERSGS